MYPDGHSDGSGSVTLSWTQFPSSSLLNPSEHPWVSGTGIGIGGV